MDKVASNIKPEKKIIALFGGSFDPLHNGHLQMAKEAQDILNANEFRFMPCYIPPHKDGLQAGVADRRAMLEAAISGLDGFGIELYELEKQETSYSIETLEYLKESSAKDATLVLVVGWDSFEALETWSRWREIFDYAHLAVVRRSDCKGQLSRNIQSLMLERRAGLQSIYENDAGKIIFLDTGLVNISSTEIRERLAQGLSVDEFLPAEVNEYIKCHKIYG